MLTKLGDTSKAVIFTVLVLLIALTPTLLFNALGLTSEGVVPYGRFSGSS